MNPGLRNAHKKINFKSKKILEDVCLIKKFDLRLKIITKKVLGQFQNNLENCSRHQKNASYIISIYGNCMISIFLQKNFLIYLV